VAFGGLPDGEALELDTPLEFEIHPQGLVLLVTKENLSAAGRRRARNISVGDLVAIARGLDPIADRISGVATAPSRRRPCK